MLGKTDLGLGRPACLLCSIHFQASAGAPLSCCGPGAAIPRTACAKGQAFLFVLRCLRGCVLSQVGERRAAVRLSMREKSRRTCPCTLRILLTPHRLGIGIVCRWPESRGVLSDVGSHIH